MNVDDRQKSTPDFRTPQMTDEVVALLRRRVAARYYEQPEVVDAIARSIMTSFGSGDNPLERSLWIHRLPSRALLRD